MKLYIVSENGGQYEDFYDIPRAVCKTKELALLLQKYLYSYLEGSCKISKDKWNEMYEKLEEYESKNDSVDEEVEDILLKLFPEYTLTDIEEAIEAYDCYYNEDIDFDVKEIDYVECEDDIMKIINGLRD